MLHHFSARTALIIIFISPCECTLTAMEARTLDSGTAGFCFTLRDCSASTQSDLNSHTETSKPALDYVYFCLLCVFLVCFCICATAVLKLTITRQHRLQSIQSKKYSKTHKTHCCPLIHLLLIIFSKPYEDISLSVL